MQCLGLLADVSVSMGKEVDIFDTSEIKKFEYKQKRGELYTPNLFIIIIQWWQSVRVSRKVCVCVCEGTNNEYNDFQKADSLPPVCLTDSISQPTLYVI